MKSFLIALMLLVFISKSAQAEYTIYGLIKETIIHKNTNEVSDPTYESGFTTKDSDADIRLGLKGYSETNYVFNFLYKFEVDIDSAKDNNGAFQDRNTFIGILNRNGAYVLGRLNEAPKAAVNFLDNWTTPMVNPFGAATGYLPSVSISGQNPGSASLLQSADNTIGYLSNRLSNGVKFGVNLNGGKSSGDYSLIAQVGVSVHYLHSDWLQMGFGYDKKANTGESDKNNAKTLTVFGIEYDANNYIKKLSIGVLLSSASEGDASMSGSNIDFTYQIVADAKARIGVADFSKKVDSNTTKNSVTGFELTYNLAKNTVVYYGISDNNSTLDNKTVYSTRVNSLGLAHKF